MARKATLGAEFQSVTADVEIDSITGLPTIETAIIRHPGKASYKFTAAATTAFITRQYAAANSTHDVYICAYMYFTAFPGANNISIMLFRGTTAGNIIDLRVNTAGTLLITNEQAASAQVGNTSSALNLNQWYRIELSYVYSTGVTNAYLTPTNGLVDLGPRVNFASGTATASVANDTFRLGVIDSATMTFYGDDIAINDETTGGTQTGLIGAHNVIIQLPSAAGDINTFATQTGGTAGAANNFSRVKEVPPDDATTFNGSSTLNEEDLFKMATPSLNSGYTINVVEVWGRFRNSTADATGAFKFELQKVASGTKSQSAAIIPNSTTWKMNALAVPKTPPIIAYQDPDSINWNPSLLNNNVQAGYIESTAPGTAGRRCDVTLVALIIDYTPDTSIYNNQLNNYQSVRAGDGVSVGEKIR